ncbi:ABC transporter permease [Bacillus cereus]|uniref:ABC transporter permease n=1 Tax=Bacillus cereus TaxID=1396 RepID=UPI000BF9DE3D|nr:FtsX-like permease family protein [Bacillus cereus]PER95052.1 ABC transporter permease [Bacillus cereus]
MLFKLSMSGLRSKLKDYIVLLVGLIMSISIFYMFETLALNEAFLKSNSPIGAIGFIFHAGTALLTILTFFYILYANSFLLSLRQKEFGMYMMLGAKKHKVTTLMFMETIVLGIASLIIGITIGIGLSKGVGQLLMTQLDFTANGYQALYAPSVTLTCLFFLVLFVLSAVMNSIKLSRISVLQLVHAGSKIERSTIGGVKTVVIAFLAIILLAIGYASMIYMDKLKQSGIIIALITVTSGTYMLFGTFLPLVIRKLKNNKKRSEKGLNAFTFAQLNFRITSLTKVLATVAMLVALGAGAISAGMAFKNDVTLKTDSFNAYDVVIHNPNAEEKKILDGITFKEKNEYRYKTDDRFVYYLKEDLERNRPLVRDGDGLENAGKFKRISEELPIGAVSGTNVEQGPDVKEMPQMWNEGFRTIEPEYVHPDHTIKIVNQKMYDNLKGKERIVLLGKSNDFITYKKEWKKINELQLLKYKNMKEYSLDSKYSYYTLLYGMSTGIVFMGFFLGIAFLAMMASCLMFKVLSGASNDITRYKMLRKIGVRRELLTKSIYKELFLVFLFPAITGMAHVLVGMNIFSYFLINPYFHIWLPIIIFIVIYAIYYFITVQLYKGIVLPKKD